MMNRTRTIHLTLQHPFLLPGEAAPLPGGNYVVTIDEERLDQLSFEAWRRTGTWFVVRGTGAAAGRIELRPVKRLGICVASVHKLIRSGALPATQIMYSAPWKIPVDALNSEAVEIGLQEIAARRPAQAIDKITDQSITLPGF